MLLQRSLSSVVCFTYDMLLGCHLNHRPRQFFFFFSRGHTLDIEQQPLGFPCHQLSGTKLLATQSSLTGAMSYSSDFLGKEGHPRLQHHADLGLALLCVAVSPHCFDSFLSQRASLEVPNIL